MNTSNTNQVQKQEIKKLPHALHNNQLQEKLITKTMAVFLDYDGCLTPIVKNPEDAVLSEEMRQILHELADACFVAVVSGRDRENVARLVQLDNLYYAGSHGFDITGPNNLQTEPGDAAAAIPELDKAEQTLNERLQNIPGVLVERKRYAIAVHYRNVPEGQEEIVKQTVYEVLEQHEALKAGPGKKIIELKPNLDWHKGRAVQWLLKELKLDKPEVLPIYIGDDLTDEDAFATIQPYGLSIIVGDHDEKTAAHYRLANVEEVKQFLLMLSEIAKE